MLPYLWRPNIPLSIDGEPLTIATSDFFTTFPYHRLVDSSTTSSSSSPNISFFLKPSTPIFLILLYIATEKIFLPKIVKVLGIKGRSTFWKCIFSLHNFALFAFSFVVWFNSWPIVLEHVFHKGLVSTICDEDGSVWASGLGGWATIFYLSKYYEFVDTFVLIIKNKEPSFLQVYHHCGVALTMYGAVTSQSGWVLCVVLLNSGIHTLMYLYFLVKTLNPTLEIKQAKYLTTLQILQFMSGILVSAGVVFVFGRCDTPASRLTCAVIDLYAVGLIVLFTLFAKKKYKKKKE